MKTADRPPSPPLSEQQRQERARAEEKKRLKRAANRRSACTSRVRKKQFVEEMTAASAQLQLYSEILARARSWRCCSLSGGEGGRSLVFMVRVYQVFARRVSQF